MWSIPYFTELLCSEVMQFKQCFFHDPSIPQFHSADWVGVKPRKQLQCEDTFAMYPLFKIVFDFLIYFFLMSKVQFKFTEEIHLA